MAYIHYPHPFNPKNSATIHREWKEIRQSKCPISGNLGPSYEGTFLEYTYLTKTKKEVYVPEFCLLVRWLS